MGGIHGEAKHCCETCYWYNGESGDGVQFCDEREIEVCDYYTGCHRWKPKLAFEESGMVDRNDIELQTGDKVEMLFYSHIEPLCSCEGTVYAGEYVEVTKGRIPLGDFYAKEVCKIN